MYFGSTETPISSVSSLISADAGFSSGSIFPPGNSHQPAQASPFGRLQASILPSASNSNPPTTSYVGLHTRQVAIRPTA